MPFLIALGIATLLGVVVAGPIAALAGTAAVKPVIVAAVMFASGATMATGSVRRSFRRRASWVAIAVNSLAMPSMMLIWLAIWPFELADSLRTGLLVAAMVPCTLASAAVWTRRAGGDDSIAMVTTVVTNLSCVATVPVFFALAIGDDAAIGGDVAIGGNAAVDVDPGEIAAKLVWTVVLPLVAASLVRRWGGAGWFDRRKDAIKWFNQAGILVMVCFGAAVGQVARQSSTAASTGLPGWIFVIATVLGVHIAALVIGVAMSRKNGDSRPVQIAVGLAGSQKTMLIGLQIAMAAGGSVMPMLAMHVSQLIVDTAVADRWRRETERLGSASERPSEKPRERPRERH